MPILAGLLSLVFFLPGITWGLPSRQADRYLFADRTPWTGQELITLTGGLESEAAADVDRDADAGKFLNDTDAERAEIVIRYRLYSQQPDEMLTLRAIASMAQRRSLDPHFYTYGGLWTYPVAGFIGVASLAGLIERGDLAFYLDRPEEFAKMYVVMRLYAVAWAAVGAGVVCILVRRMTRSGKLGLIAAACYAIIPAINIAAHEGKPHLPGAVLAMVAMVLADTYLRTASRRHLLLAGLAAGAATGMVVTMAVSTVVLPIAWWLRHEECRGLKACGPDRLASARFRRAVSPRLSELAASIALAAGVFVVTNPFVLFNIDAVSANAGNTAGHYGISQTGFWAIVSWVGRTASIFFVGGGWIGSMGVVLLLLLPLVVGRRENLRTRRQAIIYPLAGVAFLSSLTFFATSFGRPPDHVRFGLLAFMCGTVAVFGTLAFDRSKTPTGNVLTRPLPWWLGAMVLLPVLIALGPWQFVSNAWGRDGRSEAARAIAEQPISTGLLLLPNDPAPYAAPPFDLWAWKAVKTSQVVPPRFAGHVGDGYVTVSDLPRQPGYSRMGWGVRRSVVYGSGWSVVPGLRQAERQLEQMMPGTLTHQHQTDYVERLRATTRPRR